MSVFVCPQQVPETIDKGCFLVPKVSFLDEIKSNSHRQPRGNVLSRFHLRQIIASIGQKYMSPEFDALRQVNISDAVGKTFSSDEDIDQILINLFDRSCPEIFDGYARWHLKNRPMGTKLVYFMPGKRGSNAVYEIGLQPIAPKDVDKFLGKKDKQEAAPAVETEELKTPKVTKKTAKNTDKNESLV